MNDINPNLKSPKGPIMVDLEAGAKLAWCSCGYSAKDPYCDGSHKAHGMAPKVIEVPETKKYALCGCKKTSNAPYCDGSHARA